MFIKAQVNRFLDIVEAQSLLHRTACFFQRNKSLSGFVKCPTGVKYACGVWNRCGGEGFISFHLMRSIKFHNLQSKLFHRERQRAISLLFRLSVLNQKRGACRGEPPCRRRWRMKAWRWGEETRSSAKRSIVLGSSISFVSAFGENSFIARLVLSQKGKPFWDPVLCDYVSEGQLQVLLPLPKQKLWNRWDIMVSGFFLLFFAMTLFFRIVIITVDYRRLSITMCPWYAPEKPCRLPYKNYGVRFFYTKSSIFLHIRRQKQICKTELRSTS